MKRITGTVTAFNASKGYGWVLPDAADSRRTIFIHIKEVVGKKLLREGDRVLFEIAETERGLKAINTVLLLGRAGSQILVDPPAVRS